MAIKKKKKVSKNKIMSNKASKKQLESLAKARAAKKSYAELRTAGFNRGNISEASRIIEAEISHLDYINKGANPAVNKLLSEIGDFKSAEEIEGMTKQEYYRYATSLRAFLGNPLSAEDAAKRLSDGIYSEVIGVAFQRRKGERRSNYLQRRKAFIDANEETAKKAFSLYRRLEETSAGLIIRKKFQPAAYGSDNLIIDLFDFVENEYDGDINKATDYWREMLEQQSMQKIASIKYGVEIEKFNWRRESNYGQFVSKSKRFNR